MVIEPTPPQPAPGPKKGLLHNPWVWATLAGLVTIPLIRPLFRRVPDPPSVLTTLPDFELTDHQGRSVGSRTLAGRVYLANFFFTSCPTVCPPLMRATKTLVERLARAELPVQMVSITVDPEIDTVAKLAAYATELGADTQRWTFLTGDRRAIRSLAIDGFKTHLGDKGTLDSGLVDISHATRLMLVDGAGRVRGYYDHSTLGLDEAFHRAKHVLGEDLAPTEAQ